MKASHSADGLRSSLASTRMKPASALAGPLTEADAVSGQAGGVGGGDAASGPPNSSLAVDPLLEEAAMMGLTWLGSGPAHAALEGEEREVADESGSVESFSGSVVSLIRRGSGSVLFRMYGRIDVGLAGMVWREGCKVSNPRLDR